jgi:hypothetical protein
MNVARPDIYISADVETDGPVPGPYSMLSFGLSVVGTYDGRRLLRADVSDAAGSFYRELRPISDEFDQEALAINGLDRGALSREGADPIHAMLDAAAWVEGVSQGNRPVLVAYPVAFDWSFLYWYFERFAGSSPFGHSSCLDIRTYFHAIAGTVFDLSGKSSMPEALLPNREHTHNALDDAIEQGELFANLFDMSTRARNELHHRHGHDTTPSWIKSRIVRIS